MMWELACWRKAGSTPSVPQTLPLFEKTNSASTDQLPLLPPDRKRELLRREFAVLGFLCDRHPMEFLTFEDETGIVETTFFPQAYRRFCHMIDRNRPYLLTGKVEAD
jgi:hypothetical protein